MQPNAEPSFVVASNPAALDFNTTPLPITVANFATSISAGSGESGQTVSFEITGSTDTALLPLANVAISSSGTLTYSPTPDMSGTTMVAVQLRDNGGVIAFGDELSGPKSFTITVNSIRTPGALSVFEDVPKTITGLSFADPDPGTPDVEVTLSVTNGTLNVRTDVGGGVTGLQVAGNGTANVTLTAPASAINTTFASAIGLVYTTALGFFGSDLLEVVPDGDPSGPGVTEAKTVAITAAEVNDEPSFTLAGPTLTAVADGEARTVGGFAANISTGGNDTGQTVEFLVSNDMPSLFSVQPSISEDGTLTYTPAENVSGVATVMVTIRDDGGTANGGDDTGNTETFTITVSANGPPTVPNVIEDQTATVGQPFSFVVPTDTFTDPEGDAITLSAIGLPAGLTFEAAPASPNPTGTFSGTPTTAGTFSVTVTRTSTGGSVSDTFTITVSVANQPPTVANAIADRTVGVNQAVSFTVPTNTFTDPEGDAIALSATGLPPGITFSAGPPSATPTGTFGGAPTAIGTFNVTVRATATGGFVEDTFIITVVAVNDAPTFTVGPDQTVAVNSGAQTVLFWATGISAGPSDEAGQTVSFAISNTRPNLFSVQPAVAADGTLTYTPAPGAIGTAVVSVQAVDDGGTDNGGINASLVATFDIIISGTPNTPNVSTPPGANFVDEANPVYETPKKGTLRAFVQDGLLIVEINGVPQPVYEPSLVETLTIIGGSKNDEIDLSGLVDELGDTLYDALTLVVIKGGSGKDRIVGSFADDSIDGGSGNDTLSGGDGDDTILGGSGKDLLTETADVDFTLTDTELEGLGTDTLFTIEMAELTGGESGNLIDASAFMRGPVTLRGGAGDDELIGGFKNDVLLGEDGDDDLFGGDGKDTILGGFGDDDLNGDAGNDLLIGGFEDDTIVGGDGRDTVVGGNGGKARGGEGVDDDGDDLDDDSNERIDEAFKKIFAFE